MSLLLIGGVESIFAQTPAGTTILNQATAKYIFKNQQKTVSSGIVSFTVASQPNFDIAYSLADSNMIAGDTVQIWLTFRNTGNATADTLTIRNTISDSRLRLLNVSGNGVVKGDSITWLRFNFAPTDIDSEFFIVVIPSNFSAGTFLAASGVLSWQDFSKTISQHLVVGSFARLEVSVIPSLTVVGSGRTIDYQVVARNTGNSSALAAVLTDSLGSTGTVQQVSPAPDAVSNGGNVMRWNFGTLSAFSQRTISLTARSFPNLGASQLKNIALLSASNVSKTSSQEMITPIVPVRPKTMRLQVSTQYIFGQLNQDSTQITAALFDSLDSPLPDGVPVVFTTTLGTFFNNTLSLTALTSNGQASVYLHSAYVANDIRTATVTATAGVPQSGTLNANVNIIMYPSAITGFVKEKVGKELAPMPGAVVRVYSDYDTVHYAGVDTSDEQGLYFVVLRRDFSAKYFIVKITVLDNFGQPVTSSLIFTQGSNPEPAVRMLNSIAGRLQYFSMNVPVPIPGVPVLLDSLGQTTVQGMSVQRTGSPAFHVQQSVTDQNGRYLFENLPPAVYRIWVDSTKFPQYAGVDTITLNESGIFTINANIFVQVDSSALMTMASPDTMYADSAYTLFIHVANTGNINHTNIVLRDTLNSGFVFLGAAQGIFDSLSYNSTTHVVEWRSAMMAQKIDTTLWMKVGFVPNISNGTVFTNSAWMKSDQLTSWIKSQRTMIIRSSPKITFGQFIEGGVDSIVAGYPVKFKVWFSNTGTDSLHNVVIRDTIYNAAMSGISVQIDTSKYAVKDSAAVHDSVVTWNVHSIPPGMFDTLHILLRTDPRLPGGAAIKSNGTMLQNGIQIFSANQTVTSVLNSQIVTYLVINKTGNKRSAEIGDVVTYQITINNNSPDSIYHLQIVDQLPYAFEYYKGSGHYNGVGLEPVKHNRTLSWTVLPSLAKGVPSTLVYQLVLGADALESNGMNSAVAVGTTIDGAPLYSAPSQWQVAVKPGVFTDRGIIFGKIFYDDDRNAYQSDGEDGVKNVEIWMEDGTRITTGDNGKYSLPNVKPGEHVLRVNEKTLPKGTELIAGKHDFAGDASSRFVTLTDGGIVRANFYVKRTFQDSLVQSVSTTIRFAARKIEAPKDIFIRSGAGASEPQNTAEYILQLNYSGPAWIQRIAVTDSLPAGFEYIEGSGMFNGRRVVPTENGQLLQWNLGRGLSPLEGELRYRVHVRYSELQKVSARSYSYVEIMNADSLTAVLDTLWTTTYVQSYPYRETAFKIEGPVFEAGKISLRSDAFKAFDRMRSIVRKYPKSNFVVVGFPDGLALDNSRRDEDSLLAQKRAEAALDFLYRRIGKDSLRLTSSGVFDLDSTNNIFGTSVEQVSGRSDGTPHLELIMRDYFLDELVQKAHVDSVDDFSTTEEVPELEKYFRDSIDVSPDDHIIFRVSVFSNPLAKSKEVTLLDTLPHPVNLRKERMRLNEIPIYSPVKKSRVFISRITTLLRKGKNEITFNGSLVSANLADTLRNQIWLRRINNFDEITFEKTNCVKIVVGQKTLPLLLNRETFLAEKRKRIQTGDWGEINPSPSSLPARQAIQPQRLKRNY